MKSPIHNAHHDHDEVFSLLPWYVNGSLDQAESQRAEAHTKVCLRCRGELLAQQKIAQRIQDADIGALEINAGFESLRARIASAETQETRAPYFIKLTRLPRYCIAFMRSSSYFPVTAVTAGLVVILAIGSLATNYDATAPSGQSDIGREYQTLAAKPLRTKIEREILVVFKPEVSASEINVVLGELGALTVNLPNENGVMRIAIAGDNPSRDATLEVVTKLKHSPLVMFAEPAIASAYRAVK